MTDEQEVLQTVEKLWDEFDTDKNGNLDMKETKLLIQKALNAEAGEEISDAAFKDVFEMIDIDQSGTVEKDEMKAFIVKMVS